MNSPELDLAQRYYPQAKWTLVRDNKYVYTLDVNAEVHTYILNEQPISMWKYDDTATPAITQGRTRIQVLKNLYIGLILRYS